MKKYIQVLGLIAGIWLVGAAPGLGMGKLPPGVEREAPAGAGRGAPAPAIGAGMIGVLLAGGVAYFIRKRRHD